MLYARERTTKKKLRSLIEYEQQKELAHIIERVSQKGETDLEAMEFYVRSAVLALGAKVLGKALEGLVQGRRQEPMICCGQKMHSQGRRPKRLRTIMGPVPLRRSEFKCEVCGATRIPGDELLDIAGSSFSPGARRMMVRAGSRESFREAAEDLWFYAQLEVDSKSVERVAEEVGEQIAAWMQREGQKAIWDESCERVPAEAGEPAEVLYISYDGTGVPIRRGELANIKGKQADGSAKTREVKLGCVFTQISADEQGRPQRDPGSSSYLGAIEDSVTFGYKVWAEALRRGMRQAGKVVVLTDGAAYNKSIIKKHFPQAISIIDYYHALEHLDDMAKRLLPDESRPALEPGWRELLWEGKVEALLEEMQSHLPSSGKRREEAVKGMRYFQENADAMRYGDFRRQGLFIGSGVVEAGCRTLIGKRLKNSGMFWSVSGANAIIAARCCQYSRRFEQFWEDARHLKTS